MQLTAIRDHIVFQFIDKITIDNRFVRENTETGLYLGASFDESAKTARWAKVLAIGPDADRIFLRPDIEVLIEALKWTEAANIPNVGKVWRTDQKQILGYRTKK